MAKRAQDKYKHHCPFCGHNWYGYREDIVACVRCKVRGDYPYKKAGKGFKVEHFRGR